MPRRCRVHIARVGVCGARSTVIGGECSAARDRARQDVTPEVTNSPLMSRNALPPRSRARGAVTVALICTVALVLSACRTTEYRTQRHVTDDAGRRLVLHGVNVSSSAKSDPLNMPWVTEADVRRLSDDFGWNFTRFLVFWSAVEPSPGVIDEVYLDRVEERLDWFAAAGVHVVLDMHQDVWGPSLGGNGAPAWATRTDGQPDLPPLPGAWWLGYIRPPVIRAYDNFFAPTGEGPGGENVLQRHYADMFTAVAERFADHPAVIGYEIMNEPFGGSNWANFETERLRPFYQRVIDAIRRVDTDSWIFFEPQVPLQTFGFPSEVGPLADPRDGEDRLVYFPHHYQPGDFEGVDVRYEGNTLFMDAYATNRSAEADRWDVPLLTGEFGLNADVPGSTQYLYDFLARAEAIGSGWAYWSHDLGGWSPTNADGSEQREITDALVRTYPQAIAGDPEFVRYDPTTRVLDLRFRPDPAVTAPTVVSIPADRFYADGFSVDVDAPAERWSGSWDPATERYELTVDPSVSVVSVRVAPAN